MRGLWRNPGFSVTALLVLSTAIAANAMLFALFNAYALRNPPIERPERWVSIDAKKATGRVLDRWTQADADALLRDRADRSAARRMIGRSTAGGWRIPPERPAIAKRSGDFLGDQRKPPPAYSCSPVSQ